MDKKTICIVLASGLSQRLMENKLLLPINGTTLLENTLKVINKIDFHRKIVVLNDINFIKLAQKYNYEFVINENPVRGQGSSIKLALEKCDKNYSLLFCVADMPFLNENTINEIINLSYCSPEKIIRPKYQNIVGNPVLFPKKYYDKLKNISDTKGGTSVEDDISKFEYLHINNPKELRDIDTLDDYLTLLDKKIYVVNNSDKTQYNVFKENINQNDYVVFYNKKTTSKISAIPIKIVSTILDLLYCDFSKEMIFIDKNLYNKLAKTISNKIIYL